MSVDTPGAPPGSPLASVYEALRDHGCEHSTGQDWQCPAHDDQRASLGVSAGDRQPVVLSCQAGCSYDEVLAALGLTKADLKPKMRVVTTYAYDGYEVDRLEDGVGGKEFKQYGLDSHGKRRRGPHPMAGVEHVLFRKGRVESAAQAGQTIYVVEGEKAVQALVRRRVAVTTASGGASAKWLPSYTQSLRGAGRVILIPDRDKPGYGYMGRVYDELHRAGIPVSVRASKTTGKGDDIVEHLAAGHSLADLVPLTRSDLVWRDPLSGDYGHLGRMLSRSELAALPKPEPLISGWLDLRTTVVVVGDTGTNKTFAILGWLCSVATGEPWLGHAVTTEPASVVLAVGEGGSGLDDRIAAWEAETGVAVPPDRFNVLLQPDSIATPEFWEDVTAFAVERGARMVALDTFSSLAPEADETTDAAVVVRRMGELAAEIDGTVLLAHHTGWNDKGRARGASQLEANPDAVIVLEKAEKTDDPNAPVSIRRKKVKDGPAGATLWVQRVPVESSCVLEVAGQPIKISIPSDFEARALLVLSDHDPFTLTRFKLEEAMGGNKDRRAHAVEALLKSGAVEARPVAAPEGRDGVMKQRIRLGLTDKAGAGRG